MPGSPAVTRWLWVRHAPTDPDGRIIGRTDLPILEPEGESLVRAATLLRSADVLLCSPMDRCRRTAELLRAVGSGMPDPIFDDRLMEQDFGAWEGRRYADVAAWDDLPLRDMAALRPPGGESFLDLVARVRDAVADNGSRFAGRAIAVMSHAGVIRAATAIALEMPPHRGLSLGIVPLSVTGLTDHGDGGWAVDFVNRT